MLKEMLGLAEGILQDLHNDHKEVAALIDRIMESESGSERAALFQEMSTKLLAHAHAEQEILYAPMTRSKSKETKEFALEGKSEHQHVEEQVRKIRGMGDPVGTAWTAELKVLKDLVEHHVDEEEDTGFDCARNDFDEDQLKAMGRQFQARKQELMATSGRA